MSKKKQIQIYQFKITLANIKPRIWRRIQVPDDFNFDDLHEAIQNAMGWDNYHLHEFTMLSPKTGMKERIAEIFEDAMAGEFDIINEFKAKISKYFTLTNKRAKYEYDFGDGWKHDILLEKIIPVENEIKYPRCVAGERACPPEDCGGTYGYEYCLEALNNPNNPEYEERLEWLGEFDPEEFDANKVEFPNANILMSR